MIVRLGEDPDREGLARTPARVEKAMKFLVKGYKDDPEAYCARRYSPSTMTKW
jgi:GTP cyclohydrolase I